MLKFPKCDAMSQYWDEQEWTGEWSPIGDGRQWHKKLKVFRGGKELK